MMGCAKYLLVFVAGAIAATIIIPSLGNHESWTQRYGNSVVGLRPASNVRSPNNNQTTTPPSSVTKNNVLATTTKNNLSLFAEKETAAETSDSLVPKEDESAREETEDYPLSKENENSGKNTDASPVSKEHENVGQEPSDSVFSKENETTDEETSNSPVSKEQESSGEETDETLTNTDQDPVDQEERHSASPVSSLLANVPYGKLKEDSVIVLYDVRRAGSINLLGSVVANTSGTVGLLTCPKKKMTWEKTSLLISRAVSTPPAQRNKHKTSFFDIRTGGPTFLEMQDNLRYWRGNATLNGVNFFVFTIMRDPLSLALEHFNQLHRNNGYQNKPKKPPNQEVFLEFAQHDPLCSYYAYQYQYELQPFERSIPTKETCDAVLKGLREHMDWVGTTDNHEETVSIVKHLLGMPRELAIPPDSPFKARLKVLTMDEIGPETIQAHQNMTKLDAELYEAVRDWPLRLSGIH